MTNGNELIHSFGGTANSEPNFAGLTKREYFAAMAMSGIMGRSGDWNKVDSLSFVAKQARLVADELISELNKTPSQPQP